MPLNDKTKFEYFDGDILQLSNRLKNKVYRFLSQLKNIISPDLNLLPTGSHPGVFYDLLMIHKTLVPLRPIESCSGCHKLKLS